MTNKDVAIIGAGVSGLFSAYQCSVVGLSCAVIESLPYAGGQCSALYPNKIIYGVPGIIDYTASQFIDCLLKQCENTDFYFNTHAHLSLKNDLFFITYNELTITSTYVILASGIGKMSPIIPQNIIGLKELQKKTDFVQFYSNKLDKYKDKVVVVAGGGNSAVDIAINISTVAKKVILLHRRQSLSCDCNKLQNINKYNIIIKLGYSIEELKQNLVITNKENISANYIVFCYGFIPDNSVLSNLDVELEQNLIKTDINTMQTSLKNCYAVGDAVKYYGKTKDIVSCCFEAKRAVQSISNNISEKINGRKRE